MTVFFHEMKRGSQPLIIWSVVVSFMLAAAILLYPQMEPQMSEMEGMLADMGSFSSAFGMDKMNFSRFPDYFAIECGNTVGIGGAIFAALTGISMLCKEEKEKTAEFLFTHPVSRCRIVLEKLLALIVQIVIFNAVLSAVTVLSSVIIGKASDLADMWLILLAYLILETEIAMICFGISSFIRSGIGIGIGIAVGMYFLNIISNITEDVKFLKYITPYAYADGAELLTNHYIDGVYLAIGITLAAVCAAAAFFRTAKKDIFC